MTIPSPDLFPSEFLFPDGPPTKPKSKDFYRTRLEGGWAVLKGAGRILTNDEDSAFPSNISEIIDLNTYDAVNGWKDLGATKGGITASVNHTEETLQVDQIFGDIDSSPTSWEASIQTVLAEPTLENIRLAWEGSEIISTPEGRYLGYGQSDKYSKMRLAVLYRDKGTGKIRAHVARIAQLQPSESSIVYSREGDQQSLPVQFKIIADTDVPDPRSRFLVVYEQP